MRYRTIIQWIDSELERLEAARGVLTRVEASRPPERPTLARTRTRRPIVIVESVAPPSTEPLLKAAKPERSAPRTRIAVRPGPGKPVEPRALSGKIPLGPVVIAPPALQESMKRMPPPLAVAEAKPEYSADGTLEALVRDLQARQNL